MSPSENIAMIKTNSLEGIIKSDALKVPAG
jgi:hypothetical protein